MRFAAFVISASLAVEQAPRRERPLPAAMGSVRGTVVSSVTGQPLHRVRVTLSGGTQAVQPAVTNTRGEFEVVSVPAGTYNVTARRAGYLTTQFGQRGNERGRPIVVPAGETIRNVNFSLVRGAVIAGTVSDETGIEYAGVRVDALEYRYLRGRQVPVTAATTSTNDLGQFRLPGLPTGRYVIRATASATWTNEADSATQVYAPTYYPGAASIAEGEVIALLASQEMSNVNFALRPGRAARIVGRYEAADAPVGGQSVNLSLITRTVGNEVQSSSGAGTTRTSSDGTFEFRGLSPGEYTVSTGSDKDRGSVTVVLSEGDERTVAIGPRSPTLVTGNILVESAQPPRFAAGRLSVVTIAADPDYLPPSTFTSPFASVAGAGWAFRYPDLVGKYLFRLQGLPDDWLLRSVAVSGNDITDVPLELGAGRSPGGPIQITITDRAATLVGRVVGADERPTPDATIVVFTADRARWTVASRFVKVGRPRSDGQFTVSGLAAGRYLAVARPAVAEGQWEDPAFLSSLAETAAPFEARLEEPAMLDLRLPRVP